MWLRGCFLHGGVVARGEIGNGSRATGRSEDGRIGGFKDPGSGEIFSTVFFWFSALESHGFSGVLSCCGLEDGRMGGWEDSASETSEDGAESETE